VERAVERVQAAVLVPAEAEALARVGRVEGRPVAAVRATEVLAAQE